MGRRIWIWSYHGIFIQEPLNSTLHSPMKYAPLLVEGRLIRRYQRFLADVMVDGSEVTVHCPNSGSMKTCLEPGARVWLSRSSNSQRKYPYTWELAELGGVMVFLHPALANTLAVEAISNGMLTELEGYATLRREVVYGKNSRIDVLLEDPKRGRCFVEVKHATLNLGGGRSSFPDAVTSRGTKHLRELMAQKQAGDRAVVLFTVGRSDAESVEPADDIDPTYGAALREAARAGVEVLARRCQFGESEVWLGPALPVVIGPNVAC